MSPSKIGDQRPDLFVEKAYDQGVIDEKLFSIKFGGDDAASQITFGGYDTEIFAKEDLIWYPNYTPYPKHYFWAVELEGLIAGDVLYTDIEPFGVVDSGSSYILMPWSLFEPFMEHKLKPVTTCTADEYMQISCDCPVEIYDKLPELTFIIGGK